MRQAGGVVEMSKCQRVMRGFRFACLSSAQTASQAVSPSRRESELLRGSSLCLLRIAPSGACGLLWPYIIPPSLGCLFERAMEKSSRERIGSIHDGR
jgi:hypothetical protein